MIYNVQGMGNNKIQAMKLRDQSLMTKIMLNKQKDIIQHIRQQKIIIIQPINQMGDTLGHYAAYKAQYQVLEYLIKSGDTFNIANYRGQSAIDVALPEVREWLYDKIGQSIH